MVADSLGGYRGAGLYVAMIVPLLVGWASTSSNVRVGPSSANSRLRPPPATTGLIIRVSSSSSPRSISDRTRVGLPAVAPGTAAAGSAPPRRARRRRGHGHADQPAAGWVPTSERFRDPSTSMVMRVWVDPADQSRHYVPEPES